MAGDFWAGTHCKEWLMTKEVLLKNRAEDLKYLTEKEYNKFMIFLANVTQNIGEGMRVPQQVIATATVYLKRFYSKHSFQDCDPVLMLATCIYTASKVEEYGPLSNSRLQNVITNSIKKNFSYAWPEFPYNIKQVWECEFYLLEMTDCSLVVFHPYRCLINYVHDLNLNDNGEMLRVAWNAVNDSYRTDVSLLYPPHLIALTCIHIAGVSQSYENKFVEWISDLNVSIPTIMEISDIILEMHEIYHTFDQKAEIEVLLKKIPKPLLSLDKKESSTK